MFCQFVLYILIPQTRQLLTRARNTSTVVQWSLQKTPFNLCHQFKPIPHSRQHNWRNSPSPKSTKHLPKPCELPADPSCPQPLLPATSSQPLCPTTRTRDRWQVTAEKLCYSKPATALKRCSLRSYLLKKCCPPSVVAVMQRMETASYLLVLWYLEESLSSCQEGVRCTVWPEICILYFIKIEF